MLLNRFEYLLMSKPVRAVVQRRLEASRLLELGGALAGGAALIVGWRRLGGCVAWCAARKPRAT